MKTNLQRIAAWLMILMMVVGCIPVSAAEELTKDFSNTLSIADYLSDNSDANVATKTLTFTWDDAFDSYVYDKTTDALAQKPYTLTVPVGSSISASQLSMPPIEIRNHSEDASETKYLSIYNWKNSSNYEYVTADSEIYDDTDYSSIMLQLFAENETYISFNFVCGCNDRRTVNFGSPNIKIGESLTASQIPTTATPSSDCATYQDKDNIRFSGEWTIAKAGIPLTSDVVFTEENVTAWRYEDSLDQILIDISANWEMRIAYTYTDSETKENRSGELWVRKGQTIGNNLPTGYVWVDGAGNAVKANTVVTAPMTLTGTPATTYTVTYEAGEHGSFGKGVEINQTVVAGEAIGENIATVVIVPDEGYQFTGWATADGTPVKADTIVDADMTVIAQYASLSAAKITINNVLASKLREEQLAAINSIAVGMLVSQISIPGFVPGKYVVYSDGTRSPTPFDHWEWTDTTAQTVSLLDRLVARALAEGNDTVTDEGVLTAVFASIDDSAALDSISKTSNSDKAQTFTIPVYYYNTTDGVTHRRTSDFSVVGPTYWNGPNQTTTTFGETEANVAANVGSGYEFVGVAVGSSTSGVPNLVVGDQVEFDVNITKTGNIFQRQYTSKLTGISEGQAIYVQYEAPTPSAVFDVNGGTGTAPETVTGNIDETFTFPSGDGLSKVGDVFKGWSTSPNAATDGSTVYPAGARGTLTAGKEIYYAVWAVGVTLSFNANEGSGSVQSITCSKDDIVTLPDGTGFSRNDGYTFMGWGTDPNSGGSGDNMKKPVYPVGYKYLVSGNTTLYAIWGKQSSAEFFIRLDGQFPNEPDTSENTVGKTYYTGNGTGNPGDGMTGTVKYDTFYFNTSGVGDRLESSPSVKAIYQACEDALGNGKEIFFADRSKYVSCSSSEEFDKLYYVLWYVIKNPDGLHVDGVLLKRTLYLVTYNPNAAYGEYYGVIPNGTQYAAGNQVSIAADNLTREGYTFGGWSSDADEGIYHKGDTFIMPKKDVTLTAIWIPNNATEYKIEHYWVGLDGTATLHETETKTGTTGAPVTAEPNSYEGYTYAAEYNEGSNVEVKTGNIQPDGSLVLKLYYRRDTGAATITKTVKDSQFTGGTRIFTFTIAPATGSIVTDDEFLKWKAKEGNSSTVTVKVSANGVAVTSSALTGLPTGTYTVTETGMQPEGTSYATTVNDVASNTRSGVLTVTKGGSANIEFVNTANTKFDYSATKAWSDYNNAFGTRPESLTLTLQRVVSGGTSQQVEDALTPTVVKNDQNNQWTYTWSDLPKYDADGNQYTYSVVENSVPDGYDKSGDYGNSITNTLKTQTITVTKTVTGNMGNINQDFTFKVTLRDNEGTALTVKPDGMTDEQWSPFKDGTFTLNGSTNKSKVITVPYGASIQIEETAVSGYTTQYQVDHDTAQQSNSCSINSISGDHTVAFTNDNTATIDTGVTLDFLPYVLLILGVGVVVALWLVMSAKKRKDD